MARRRDGSQCDLMPNVQFERQYVGIEYSEAIAASAHPGLATGLPLPTPLRGAAPLYAMRMDGTAENLPLTFHSACRLHAIRCTTAQHIAVRCSEPVSHNGHAKHVVAR